MTDATVNHIDYTKRIEELETEIKNMKLILSNALTLKSFTFEVTFSETWTNSTSVNSFRPVDKENNEYDRALIGLYNSISSIDLSAVLSNTIFEAVYNSPLAHLEMSFIHNKQEYVICAMKTHAHYTNLYHMDFSMTNHVNCINSSLNHFNLYKNKEKKIYLIYYTASYGTVSLDPVIAGKTFAFTIKYT